MDTLQHSSFILPLTVFEIWRDCGRTPRPVAEGLPTRLGCVVDQQPADAAEDTPTRLWSMRHAHSVSMLGKDAYATQLVVAFIISSVLPAFGTGSHRKPGGAVRFAGGASKARTAQPDFEVA